MVITKIPLDVTPRLETASRQLVALAAELGQLPCGMIPSDPGERARLGRDAEDVIARLARVADDLRQVVKTLAVVEELDEACRRPRAGLRLILQSLPSVRVGAGPGADVGCYAQGQAGGAAERVDRLTP